MPKAPRKSILKSRPAPAPVGSSRTQVSFNPHDEKMEFVPDCPQLLGVPPSPGPLRNLRKYVYHLSRDQVAALRAPHDGTHNPEGYPWNWSSGVFERLQAGKSAVPRGTIKVTIEMPAAYTEVELPRDLLVRDDAELAKMAMEEEDDDHDHDDDEDDENEDDENEDEDGDQEDIEDEEEDQEKEDGEEGEA